MSGCRQSFDHDATENVIRRRRPERAPPLPTWNGLCVDYWPADRGACGQAWASVLLLGTVCGGGRGAAVARGPRRGLLRAEAQLVDDVVDVGGDARMI